MQYAVNAHIYVLTHTHVNNTHVNRYVAQLQSTLKRTRQSAPASNRYTHTHTSLSHAPSVSLTHTLPLTHIHTLSRLFVLARSLSVSHARSLSLFLSPTHIRTLTYIHTLIVFHSNISSLQNLPYKLIIELFSARRAMRSGAMRSGYFAKSSQKSVCR